MHFQQVLTQIKNKTNLHIFIAGLIFIGIFVAFFHSILFSNSFIISDGLIPAYFKITTWSNSIYSGFPLTTDPIWNLFYPLKFIVYKLLHLDFNFFIISGYFLMAFFTYCYMYSLTRLKTAAFISAIIFSFSGYGIFEIGHAANFVHTICWLPLILLSFEKLKNDSSFFWVVVGIIAIAMTIAGGFPQISVAIFPLIFSYALLLSSQTDNRGKKLLFYLGILAAGYLLAAPIVISTFILSMLSSRKHLTWEIFGTYYVEIKQLLLFNFPYLTGGYYGIYAKIPGFGNFEMVGNHGFVGFLSLILASLGAFLSPKNLRSIGYYWLFFCILSVLVALGPQVEFFYRTLFHIPVVNNFRAPERYLFIFCFGISALAGIGVQVIRQGLISSTSQRNKVFTLSLLAAFFLLGSVIWIYPSLQAESLAKNHFQLPAFYKNPAVFVPFIWIILSLAALFYWLKKPESLLRYLVAGAVLTVELLSTAYFSYWHPQNAFWTKEQLFNPPPYIATLRNELNKSNQRYLKMQIKGDSIGKYLWGNFPLFYHLSSAGGYTPLAIFRYTDLLQIAEGGYYIGTPPQLAANQAINIAGIKYLLTDSSAPENKLWFKDTGHFQLRNKVGETLVYENLKALPRVWFTSRVITLPSNNILEVIHSSKLLDGSHFDPAHIALVDSPQDFKFATDSNAHATIKKLGNNKVIINTQTEKAQFLVIGDVYYPGWKAYIDGKPTKIFLADYAFRGVVVPAGKHTVVFKFRPIYLYAGYAMSLLVISFLSLCFLRLCIRKISKNKD